MLAPLHECISGAQAKDTILGLSGAILFEGNMFLMKESFFFRCQLSLPLNFNNL